MGKVKLLHIGSRRRVDRIRWRRSELLHLIALLILMASFSVWVALWLESHAPR